MKYRPRRASARWLEGAPEYVLAVYDNGGWTADRYLVLFGGSLWDESIRGPRGQAHVMCLSMNGNPAHPQGVSIWDTMDPGRRYAARHEKCRWLDLPPAVRQHVIDRATATGEV